MTQQTSVNETVPLDYEVEPEEDWYEDELDEAPPRPRRKLLSPLPVTLLVVLLTAGGFLAGVEVEKGSGGASGGASGGFPSGLSALRSARSKAISGTSGATGAGSAANGLPAAAGGGFPGAGAGSSDLTSGEVSFVSGKTLYVINGEGDTVKVKAPEGTTISKTVTTSTKGVHPGETVIVRGSTSKNGTVTASSITVSSSSGSTGGAGGAGSSGGSAGTTQQLFGG